MTIAIERETTVTYNAEEDVACVWSADPVFQRRMEKLGVEPCRVDRRGEHGESRSYRVPKKWVKVKPPRQLSPEQLATSRENARFLSRKPRISVAGDHIPENTASYSGERR